MGLENKNVRIEQLPRYRLAEQLTGLQSDVAKKIKSSAGNCFNIDGQTLILGFGSFWQNSRDLRADSDVDFFTLLSKQPSCDQIVSYKRLLNENVQPLVPCYPIKPHLFIGTVYDVVNGAENLVRCLTIHKPSVDAPVIILGKNSNFNLMKHVKSDRVNNYLRDALFGISRYYYTAILNSNGELLADEKFRRTQQKFVQRFVCAVLFAENMFSEDTERLIEPDEFNDYLNRELTIKEIHDMIGWLSGKYLKQGLSKG